MPSVEIMLVLGLAVATGALVQGSVGQGLGLVAAPVVMLVDSSLMPGVLLWLASALPLLTLLREWRATDWTGVGWAIAGRVPGTAVGAWLVAAVSGRPLGLLVGLMVLVAVGLTVRMVRLPLHRSVLATAGVVSGVSGTATSIGGPPLALVYQHESGPRLRATMAVYFVAGALMSLTGLAFAGELPARQAATAAVLAPFVVVGFALSGPLRRRIDVGRVRAAVLIVCSVSALALIVRSVTG